ncbi:aspartyl-tRNA(Asn)/glutamyl-tRNA(Gln) amidotransferase subunit A [Rhizobium sp. PP-CC-2G-626]|nr:aspartyl-tRNA(Asn)/glutamyl-tRNA(Gln) amidotransferase subunit A [Rhizobium sp. PP-CC-2G-626]
MMTDILELSIAEAGDKVRAGEISFPDLVTACLVREETTRNLNAFSDLYADEALALAEAHQALLTNGCDLGPLHGIPVALKANIAIRNRRMTAGSAILADHIAAEDADVTQRLKRAGAIIIGATNMHEFAWGGTTANPHFGQCRNPWDKARIPAGSSGGSGAAVAARSAYATLGTDTGGSVRLPASMNGVTGLRPGVGRISTKGVFPLAWSMDTVGPLAPSARDCATLFSVLSGSGDMLKSLERSLAGLRIGVIDPYSFQSLQPDIDRSFRQAITLFEDMGVVFRPITIHGLDVAVDAQVIVDAAEPSAVHADWIEKRPNDYGEDVRILLQAGKTFTAIEYLQAQRYRTYLREQFDTVFGELDLVLTPTLPFTAPLIGQETIMIGDDEESTLTGNMRFTCIPSLTALPAISFPIGFDSLSLPIGAQLMAGEDKEMLLLRAVHQFQCNSVFHKARPVSARPKDS